MSHPSALGSTRATSATTLGSAASRESPGIACGGVADTLADDSSPLVLLAASALFVLLDEVFEEVSALEVLPSSVAGLLQATVNKDETNSKQPSKRESMEHLNVEIPRAMSHLGRSTGVAKIITSRPRPLAQ